MNNTVNDNNVIIAIIISYSDVYSLNTVAVTSNGGSISKKNQTNKTKQILVVEFEKYTKNDRETKAGKENTQTDSDFHVRTYERTDANHTGEHSQVASKG